MATNVDALNSITASATMGQRVAMTRRVQRQWGRKIIANTPMGVFGEPEDLNGTVLFLMSDLSKFITGICIPVDGGYSAFGGV